MGTLFRLAPVPIFYPRDLEAAIHWRLRRRHAWFGGLPVATELFAELLVRALKRAPSKAELLAGPFTAPLARPDRIQAVAEGSYREKDEAAIKGSGWVVESLEAAPMLLLAR